MYKQIDVYIILRYYSPS